MKRVRFVLGLILAAIFILMMVRARFPGKLEIRFVKFDDAQKRLVLEMTHHGLTPVYVTEPWVDYPLVSVRPDFPSSGIRKHHRWRSRAGYVPYLFLEPNQPIQILYSHQGGTSGLRTFLSRIGIALPSTGRIIPVEGYEPLSAKELARRRMRS